jgi:RNA polymerase sigma factor (sigma-70 family)
MRWWRNEHPGPDYPGHVYIQSNDLRNCAIHYVRSPAGTFTESVRVQYGQFGWERPLRTERSYPVAPVEDCAVSGVCSEVVRSNWRWVRDLSGAPSERDPACRVLFGLLLRVARAESRRRAARVGLLGPEVDDLAHQAAADALLTIIEKVGSFRGECRFTTWAYKFVVFGVREKLNRHVWRRPCGVLDEDEWDRLPDRLGLDPVAEAESRDLVAAVRRAVEESLSARQRRVFVAVVLDQVPTDVVADRLGSTPNAIYKMIFDIRRKLRGALVDSGHLPPRRAA